MTRHWENDLGWVRDDDPPPCRTCGATIPAPFGRIGRPPLYCDAHAPALRETIRRWQKTNAEAVRLYQRQHFGHRPTIAAVCPCGATFRTWSGATLCQPCRRAAR